MKNKLIKVFALVLFIASIITLASKTLPAFAEGTMTGEARELREEGERLGKAVRFNEAMEKFKEATRLNPNDAIAHANLGVTYAKPNFG